MTNTPFVFIVISRFLFVRCFVLLTLSIIVVFLVIVIVGEICPSMDLQGYDISQDMIDIAKKNVPNASYLSTNHKLNLKDTVLNASSVFHEIHAYSPDVEYDYRKFYLEILQHYEGNNFLEPLYPNFLHNDMSTSNEENL